jgi:serine/threonine-protein kinase HipA
MAVGKNRHYVIGSVLPRHFIQTGEQAGVGRGIMTSLFDMLLAKAPAALDATISILPKGFPEKVVASIAGGMEQRLGILARYAQDE